MTQHPEDLESITAALSGDKRAVLHAQLKSIQREELERLLIEIFSRTNIEEEISDIRNEVVRLQPQADGSDNPQERRDRIVLKKEVLDLTKEVREERRSTWRDVQNLEREKREVEKDLLTTAQRDKRINDFE
jgi:hypothetical protein